MRYYRIDSNIVFHGELGDNYLAIKNIIASRHIPLLGPPTSHAWLSFGPLFYYLFAPILVLFKYNPIAGAYFFAFVGVMVVALNYFIIANIFNKRVAVISSFLIAISPAYLSLAREARFFSMIVPLFYLFIYCLINKKYFLTWFILGLMLNFHLTPLILIPIAYFYLKKINLSGLLIPNIPFIIYEAINGFKMTSSLIVWVPYRVLGFIGLIHKNTLNSQVALLNINSFLNFIRVDFINSDNILITLFILLGFAFILFSLFKFKSLKDSKINLYILLIIFIFSLVSLFIHGEPPIHYFIIAYPLPIIFLSIYLDKISGTTINKLLVVILLGFITLINFKYYFSEKWFYKSQNYLEHKGNVPFKLQTQITDKIIKDSKGSDFTLTRIGEFDYFDKNYAQNYHYLLWLKGNEPKEINSLNSNININTGLRYIIYEDTNRLKREDEEYIYWVDDIAIVKKTI